MYLYTMSQVSVNPLALDENLKKLSWHDSHDSSTYYKSTSSNLLIAKFGDIEVKIDFIPCIKSRAYIP